MNSNYKLRKNQTHKYLSLKQEKQQSSPDEKAKNTSQHSAQYLNLQNKQSRPMAKDYYYKNDLKSKLLKKSASKNLQSISSTSFLVRRKHFSVFYNTQKEKQKNQLQGSKAQVSVQGIKHVKKALNFNTNSLLNTKQQQKEEKEKDRSAVSQRNHRNNTSNDHNYNQKSIKQLQSDIVMKIGKNQQKQELLLTGQTENVCKAFKKHFMAGQSQKLKQVRNIETNLLEKSKKQSQSTIRTQTSEKSQVLVSNSHSQRHFGEKDFKIKKNALSLFQKNGVLNNIAAKNKKTNNINDSKMNKKYQTETSTQYQNALKNINKSAIQKSISKVRVSSLSKDKLKICNDHTNQEVSNLQRNRNDNKKLGEQNNSQNTQDNQKSKKIFKTESNLNLQCPKNLLSSGSSLKKLQLFNPKYKKDTKNDINLDVSSEDCHLLTQAKQELPRYLIPGPLLKKNIKSVSLKQNKANNSISSFSNLSGVFQQNLNKIRSKKNEVRLIQIQHKQSFESELNKNMTDRHLQTHKQQSQSRLIHLPSIRNFHSTQQVYFQQQQQEEIEQKISQIEETSQIQQTPTPKHMQKKEKRYTQTQIMQNNQRNSLQIQQDIMRMSMHSIQCSTIQKNGNDESFLSSVGQQLMANFIQNQSLQEGLPQLKKLIQNKDKKRKIDIQKIRRRFPQDFFK